jgi:hypothetical protein
MPIESDSTGPRVVELSIPQAKFVGSVAPITVLVGGVGCLDPRTKIGEAFIGDLSSSSVVSTLQGTAVASPSFLKGRADLYLVRTESGREVIVEEHHRFLTEVGWLPLGSLGIDSLIAVDDAEGDCQNPQTKLDSQQSCGEHSHQCDEQCTFEEVLLTRQEVPPQGCVLDGAYRHDLSTCPLSPSACFGIITYLRSIPV